MTKHGICLVVMMTLAVGCQSSIDDRPSDVDRDAEIEETIDNLLLAGFPEHEIGVLEDGTVYVGQDAVVSLEASREMAGLSEDGLQFRQYRTHNLVDSSNEVICINPNAKFNNNAVLSAALDDSIADYNSQGLSFTFQRGGAGCDAGITAKEVNGSGGSAGFPSGGNPYGTINIGKGVANYGHDVAVHVINHELGHCIGFRHTDYFDRSISCGGSPLDEGQSNVGAVHIPGTPTGATMNGSVYNSCFNLGSNGNFSAGDTKALDELYGGGGGGGGDGGGGGGSCDNDGVCEAGESCDGRDGTTACGDCPGVTNGKPSNRYCYVGGSCEGPGC